MITSSSLNKTVVSLEWVAFFLSGELQAKARKFPHSKFPGEELELPHPSRLGQRIVVWRSLMRPEEPKDGCRHQNLGMRGDLDLKRG